MVACAATAGSVTKVPPCPSDDSAKLDAMYWPSSEQTLDPMVSAFFKNIAQKMTLIELLQNRAAIQEESGNEMNARFEPIRSNCRRC